MNDLAGRRVLVTGGAGFIGRHVSRALAAAGARVIVADLQSYDAADARGVQIDLTEPGAVEHVLEPGTDAVVHLAAATSVLVSVERPWQTYRTNVEMTATLLDRCRQMGVKAFVFASTNAVVGGGVQGTFDEQATLRPLTPYGATKAAGEMLLSAYSAAFGVRGTALRFTNVYGAEMTLKDSIVARLMRAAVTGKTFDIYGDGRQVRDYVYVDDVVAAVQLALTGDGAGPLVIGSGVSTSVLDVVETVRMVTGRRLSVRHVAAKPGEMPAVVVDNRLARSRGWAPHVQFADGIERVWASWPKDAASQPTVELRAPIVLGELARSS